MTLTSATHLYKHSLTFGYNEWDGEILELHFQGCKFNIHDGILGYVHPTIGWFAVVDFERDCKEDAIDSIQWVLDEYGTNYTYMILDREEYEEQARWCSLPEPEKIFGLLIGCHPHREPIEELEKEGVIKILAVEPRS